MRHWGEGMTDRDRADRPPLTFAEAMAVGVLEREGVRDVDAALAWRRRVRAGQLAGPGTAPREERLQ